MRYLIGNWKSYNTISQTHLWFEEFKKKLLPRTPLTTVICAPFTSLAEANRLIHQFNLPLEMGAQDVSPYPEGKHTGEVTARMLSELTRFCLVGHSERRRELGETSQLVAQKTRLLLEQSLIPIICLDTPYLDEQIKELLNLQLPLASCIFAYEPLSAIGSGRPANPRDAEVIAEKISFLTESLCPILYGGSVTEENLGAFLAKDHFDGALVGGDSLEATSFVKLIQAFI
jgi:triosephosphate isomerase